MSVVIKLEAQPVWARMEVMTALTGIPDNTVRHLYNEHKIRARKVRDADMPDGKGVSTVFHVGDALEWLENDAVPPREYALKGKFGNGDGLKATGFPDDYVLTGNKGEQIRQIGNAVPVNTAREIVNCVFRQD